MSQPEYVTYSRKSNGRKAVPRQKALIAQMIARQDGVILPGGEFSDKDSTAFAKPGAARPKRDDFDRMLALLGTRTGLRVAAYHADRLLRNSEDTAALIRVCAGGGHLIETHSGGLYDLSTATGRRRLRDDASAAEYEVDHNTERVLAQKDEAAAAGLWLGGRRPFGWETDPKPVDEAGEPILDEDGKPAKGYLLKREAEAGALAQAHADTLAGVPLNAIARQWNKAGLTGTSGGPWTGVEVRRVLLRPRNAGLVLHRGQVAGKAQAPAVVDEPTWRAVRALLAQPGRKTSPGPERQYLLSGIAVCGVCDALLKAGQVAGKDRQPRRVYRCRKPGKDGAHVARDVAGLDGYVSDLIVERLSRDDAAALLRPDTAGQMTALAAEKTGIEAQMRESNELRRKGLLTAAEFAEERAAHMARLEEIGDAMGSTARADALAPLVIRFRDDSRATDHAGRILVWEEQPLGARRAVITALATVTVNPQPKGRPAGWKPGESYFTPAGVDFQWKKSPKNAGKLGSKTGKAVQMHVQMELRRCTCRRESGVRLSGRWVPGAGVLSTRPGRAPLGAPT